MPGARRPPGIAVGLASRGLGAKVGLAAAAPLLGLLFVVGLFVASAPGSDSGTQGCTLTKGSANGVPANYVPWLEKAAAKYQLGPRGFSIVAAIHYVESDFGRSPLPGVAPGTQNFAGAEGPGQFLVPSWEAYGVDADSDGKKDVYSVPDSVFGTANLLHAAGAPGDWPGAIFTYNHAEWYVEEVEAKAEKIGSGDELVCEAAPAAPFGELPPRSLARVRAVAQWIESKRIHYCWGGGHGAQPGPSPGSGEFCPAGTKGLDCSGSVRWLLVLSGYADPGGLVSNELGAHYPSGAGRSVTIWSNVDHVWAEIDGRDWGTATSNFSNGPGFGPQSTAGFSPSHPPGL